MTTEEQVAELRAKIASLENRIYWLEVGRSFNIPVFNPPPTAIPIPNPLPVYCETITGHPMP